MEKKIHEAFDGLKMSENCAEKISSSFDRPAPRRIRFTPIAVAASLLLVIFVFTNSTTAQALENVGESIKAIVEDLLIPDAPVTERYKTENGSIVVQTTTDKNGKQDTHTTYIHGEIPEFLKAEEDGLYFIGNGEYIEIGNQISSEVPFTYIVTHEDGLREYIAIGGTYGEGEDGMELVGWNVYYQKPPYDSSSWMGGYGKNIFDKNGQKYQWHYAAKDILDIPFP